MELKSKNGKLGNKVVDGTYNSMIDRINSDNNPNLFFLSYNRSNWEIKDFIIVPKYYFISDFIEKRKPLSSTARRAGWIGCNILVGKIPSNGQIYLVRDSKEIDKNNVIAEWKSTEFLRNCNQQSRGWIIDIMNCIDAISENQFTLNQMYSFEKYLKNKHPENNFIKDKIRQQLQILRDKGVIDFVSRGVYQKIKG
ncbi:MAG: DpnI domain-containing protein [Lentisphaerota bacterium]